MTQPSDQPFAFTDASQSLRGKPLGLDVSLVTDPVLRAFSADPDRMPYFVDLVAEEGRLFRFIANSFADERPDGGGSRIALTDAAGGSSLMLQPDEDGRWTGRVISTEGVIDGKSYDRTIYIALGCNAETEGAIR